MNKFLIILSFLILLISHASHALALPPCPASGYKHNCFGSFTAKNGKHKGDKYIGEFKNDQKHGQGTYYYFADNLHKGDVYKGSYNYGKVTGKGVYIFANGAIYIGDFKDGKYHGQGTFTWKNGKKDVGEFKNGTLNGFAIRYDKYGNILQEGIWKDDKFLYSQNKSTSSSSNSKLDKYKSFCEEIGFVQGTEKFGDCVLEAMKKG